ncbi:hypothetical protein MTO96_039184 [Rhipicephalus appendiculatus]
MGSRPPEFDETASSWDAYRVRLEAYFEGNDITDSSKRRTLLVASLRGRVVRVIQGRCPSTPVNSVTYEEVAKGLEEHFSPQMNLLRTVAIHRAFPLQQRKQSPFVAKLGMFLLCVLGVHTCRTAMLTHSHGLAGNLQLYALPCHTENIWQCFESVLSPLSPSPLFSFLSSSVLRLLNTGPHARQALPPSSGLRCLRKTVTPG